MARKKYRQSLTPEQRTWRATLAGRIGGPARAEKLTPKQRSEIARAAARARWANKT
jgi:hypothetical protein